MLYDLGFKVCRGADVTSKLESDISYITVALFTGLITDIRISQNEGTLLGVLKDYKIWGVYTGAPLCWETTIYRLRV